MNTWSINFDVLYHLIFKVSVYRILILFALTRVYYKRVFTFDEIRRRALFRGKAEVNAKVNVRLLLTKLKDEPLVWR